MLLLSVVGCCDGSLIFSWYNVMSLFMHVIGPSVNYFLCTIPSFKNNCILIMRKALNNLKTNEWTHQEKYIRHIDFIDIIVKNDYRSIIANTNVRARDFVGNSSDAMQAIEETISGASNVTVELQRDGKFNYCLNIS